MCFLYNPESVIMAHLITAANDITPEWLTGILSASGALERGHVTSVEATTQNTVTAKALPLVVRYSVDAAGSRPERLFLKLGSRKPEVEFYLHIAPWLRHVPTLRCYDAVFDGGQTHLLFDDISSTHYAPPDALPMPMPIMERMVDILADLHYQWWEHPDLKKDGAFGALFGAMMWLWMSAVIVLVGAELNSEIEHQTAVDSTTGAPAPLGARGAVMADTIGAKA